MKTCIVTGGASGIGLATVRVLIEHGWRVVVLDRDDRALAAGAADVASPLVDWHRVDIVDEAGVAALVASLDGVAGLVNSAGIGVAKRFVDTTADDFRRVFEVNVVGTFVVAQAVVRAWRTAKRPGAIVNVASIAGQRGHYDRAAYGSSKAAAIVLTQVMASELAADGIRVNAVAPGPIATPLVDAMHSEETRARWTALVPQRRYGAPADVAHAIAFLLDDERAGFVTGHVLNVDGGAMAAGLVT